MLPIRKFKWFLRLLLNHLLLRREPEDVVHRAPDFFASEPLCDAHQILAFYGFV